MTLPTRLQAEAVCCKRDMFPQCNRLDDKRVRDIKRNLSIAAVHATVFITVIFYTYKMSECG